MCDSESEINKAYESKGKVNKEVEERKTCHFGKRESNEFRDETKISSIKRLDRRIDPIWNLRNEKKGVQGQPLSPLKGQIRRGDKTHNSTWIDLGMTFIVMTFDRIEVSGLFESRVIPIKISNPFVNTRIPFTNCSVVAFEVTYVDWIETNDCSVSQERMKKEGSQPTVKFLS